MNTTQTGYTESDAKVTARMERRAWLNEIALAEFWAAEVLRVGRWMDIYKPTGSFVMCMEMCMTDPAHKRVAATTNGNTEMEYVR